MIGWHDNQLKQVREIRVPVLDRGVQYGEGLYETMLVRGETVPLLDRHLSRLNRSCERIDLPCPGNEKLKRITSETIRANRSSGPDPIPNGPFVLKLLLTGGTGDGLYRSDPPEPNLILLPRPFPEHVDQWKNSGGYARFVPAYGDTGSDLARVKSTSRLGPSLALERVKGNDDDFREAIFVDDDHHLLQGARTNVFVRLDQTWYTPPDSEGILPGIARQVLLDGTDTETVTEEVLFSTHVLKADAVAVTNAVTGPVPIRKIVAPSLLKFDRDPRTFSVSGSTVLDRIWKESIRP